MRIILLALNLKNMKDACMLTVIKEQDLSRLKWRSRRGLLENDLIFTKFFDEYGKNLNQEQAEALELIFALGDNDLLDLILQKITIPFELQSNIEAIKIINLLQKI